MRKLMQINTVKNNKANAPTQRRFVLSGRKNIRSPLNVIITSAFFFNKDAYYHLGDYERSDTLRGLITGAWYSALGLELEDHQGLVHFPTNGRYILDINDPDFPEQHQHLLARLDYLTKLDTKAAGQRNFGYSGF